MFNFFKVFFCIFIFSANYLVVLTSFAQVDLNQELTKSSKVPESSSSQQESTADLAGTSSEKKDTQSVYYFLNLKWNLYLEEKLENPIKNFEELKEGQNSFFMVSKNEKGQILSLSYYKIDRDLDQKTMNFKRTPHLHLEGILYYSINYYYSGDSKLESKSFYNNLDQLIYKQNFIYNKENNLEAIDQYKINLKSGTEKKVKVINYHWETGRLVSLKIFDGSNTQIEDYKFKGILNLNDPNLGDFLSPVKFPNGIGNYKLSVFLLESYNRFHQNKKVYSLIYEDHKDFIIPKKYNDKGILLNQFSPYKKETALELGKQDVNSSSPSPSLTPSSSSSDTNK